MIDLGTGNNNKINWAMEDKQEMIDIIEVGLVLLLLLLLSSGVHKKLCSVYRYAQK